MLTSFFLPTAGLGSGRRVYRHSSPVPPWLWDATASGPLKETGRWNQAAPAALFRSAVLRALGRGRLGKGGDAATSKLWDSAETIVGEEGVGCCVFFIF